MQNKLLQSVNQHLYLVQSVPCKKHLGLVLDSRFNFNARKFNKIIDVMEKLLLGLAWNALLTIYKSFWTQFTINGKLFNASFRKRQKQHNIELNF